MAGLKDSEGRAEDLRNSRAPAGAVAPKNVPGIAASTRRNAGDSGRLREGLKILVKSAR